MREIKFRAWDTETKKMIVGIDKMKNYYEGILFIDELLNPNKAEIEEIKIMQFTGLKDKNGKEIYDGDILKSPSEGIGIVDFENGSFRWNRDSFACYTYGLSGKYFEIIGNKFENPELLK